MEAQIHTKGSFIILITFVTLHRHLWLNNVKSGKPTSISQQNPQQICGSEQTERLV